MIPKIGIALKYYLFTFCQVTLMNESRNNMAVLKIEVIMGAINICGDHTGERTTILLVVCPTVSGGT